VVAVKSCQVRAPVCILSVCELPCVSGCSGVLVPLNEGVRCALLCAAVYS